MLFPAGFEQCVGDAQLEINLKNVRRTAATKGRGRFVEGAGFAEGSWKVLRKYFMSNGYFAEAKRFKGSQEQKGEGRQNLRTLCFEEVVLQYKHFTRKKLCSSAPKPGLHAVHFQTI